MTGPSRHPKPRPAAAPHHPTGAPRAVHRPPAPASHRARPEQPRRSRTTVPDLSNAAPRTPDVCALGRQYGGWREDSPETRICEQTYGR
ncbi:hypothetical protein SRB17_50750 [Streptomyces sp. RB17]|nr:hypothetical protein [Streptomyces sp. RB17]